MVLQRCGISIMSSVSYQEIWKVVSVEVPKEGDRLCSHNVCKATRVRAEMISMEHKGTRMTFCHGLG